jgi:hypothetical protein
MEGHLLYDKLSGGSRKRNLQIAAAHAAVEAVFGKGQKKWGGSVRGHQVMNRDREGAWNELKRRYFDSNPMFDGITFRRRFRMDKSLWDKIV